ncbi:MAG TPA: exonuclease SbcCD subunit D [Acidimicrobiia bacterium]|nr:exonuclease SbcCD subunit D [Acidimicrobiia bacterium]
MKVLHTSDWHVGRRIRGRDRSDEHREVLSELVGLADSHDVDLTLVAGDVFDTASPTPAAEEIVWRTLLDLSEVSPVLVVAGNHDHPARLDAVAPLLDRAGVKVVGTARSPEDGGVVDLPDVGAKVALLPFVSQRAIVKVEDIMGSDPDQHAGKYEERMRRVIEMLTADLTPDTVNLLAGHLTVHGAEAGGGERTAHIFGYAIPAALFPGHLSYVALGHLHRQQKMPHSSAVWYSGSPLQLDFGEVNDQKGALLVTAEPGKPASVQELPLTSGRRLMSLTGSLEQVLARAGDTGDAYVRVVLRESARVGLADEVREAIPNAVEVVLESPTQPRSATESRQGLDPTEAFAKYLAEKDSSDPRVEALFAELLDEAQTVGTGS